MSILPFLDHANDKFSRAVAKGFGPHVVSLSRLVWHSQTGTLYVYYMLCFMSNKWTNISILFSYFIDYFYGINDAPKDPSKIKIGLEALARYGLAKPSSNEWLNKDWNGDTTGWKM